MILNFAPTTSQAIDLLMLTLIVAVGAYSVTTAICNLWSDARMALEAPRRRDRLAQGAEWRNSTPKPSEALKSHTLTIERNRS